jgi:ABC-type nickel/cobalt efflux system permease component RcnA
MRALRRVRSPARRAAVAAAAGAGVALALGLFWAAGGPDAVAAWAAEQGRAAQNALAGGVRTLRAGEPGALAALCAVAFGYGVAHAAGPGHGKLLIGAYAAASRSRVAALAVLSLAASLAQATTAVALVAVGVALFGWTRNEVAGAAEAWLAPASHLLLALLGLWLALRGLGHLRPARRAAARGPDGGTARDHAHGHAEDHAHGPDRGHGHGPACGHAHGPDPAALVRAASWREAAALVAGVALRPCTGALFLLAVTWGVGVFWAGVLAAYAMGLGTAAVTVAVAASVAVMRDGLLVPLSVGRAARLAISLLEVAAGLALALLALALLRQSL